MLSRQLKRAANQRQQILNVFVFMLFLIALSHVYISEI